MVYFVPCRHLFLPITILAVMEWFTSADAFAIGITGLCKPSLSMAVRAGSGDHRPCLIRTADSAGRNVPAKGRQNRRHSAMRRRRFFLVRPLVLDIPYLKRPEAAYLERLEFEYSRGIGDYGSDDYYLRGVDMTGERHSFEISEKRYEEGRALWGENDYNLFAKVTTCRTPHLDVARIYDRTRRVRGRIVPTIPELPNDWESFSIQINDTVYTLPVPLALSLTMGG